jgi:long-subunit acyl-CoA synthetase (AMP-forming)
MFAPTEAEQGELCYRGRNVMMGYLANPDLGNDEKWT